MDGLQDVFQQTLNEKLVQITLSNSKDADRAGKVKIRPVLIKGELFCRETLYRGTQVFHRNFRAEELVGRLTAYMADLFQQGQGSLWRCPAAGRS